MESSQKSQKTLRVFKEIFKIQMLRCYPGASDSEHQHGQGCVLWGQLCPPPKEKKKQRALLKPYPSECDLFGNRVFTEVTEFKRGRWGGPRPT